MHQDLFEKNVINKLKPNLTYNNNDINKMFNKQQGFKVTTNL